MIEVSTAHNPPCAPFGKTVLARCPRLLVLLAAGLIVLQLSAVSALAQPVPAAPQEFLYRYLQTLKLTIADTTVLDDFAARFLMADYHDAGNNEVKRLLMRQKALDMINSHKPESRVMLGFHVTYGDYDTTKQRFHLLYPMYGMGTSLPGQSSPMLVHYPSRAMVKADAPHNFRVNGCDVDPDAQYHSPFDAPGYLETFALCLQDDPKGIPYWDPPQRRSKDIPDFFKLIPSDYPDWDYLDMPLAQASMLIDQGILTHRSLWAYLVFDINNMILPPSPDLDISKERDNLRNNLTAGAGFKITPVAMFVWKLDLQNDRLPDANFLFSKGDVSTQAPPPGGVVTFAMIGKTGNTQPAASSASADAPAEAAACPAGLPADAMKGRCSEQQPLFAAGLYMDATGHVRHVGEPPTKSAIGATSPQEPTPSRTPVIGFGDGPAKK